MSIVLNMKKFIIHTFLLCITPSVSLASSDTINEAYKYKYGSDTPIEKISTTKTSGTKSNNVYICLGPNAYAYHLNKNCRGLRKCSCEIRAVSREEARKLDFKKPCGICAKGQPRLK